MVFSGKAKEYLLLTDVTSENQELIAETAPDGLSVLWNVGKALRLRVDEVACSLGDNQLLFLTEFHKVEVEEIEKARLLRFNRAFYCIIDHDSEVSCKGILFFGAEGVPIVDIPEEEAEKFETLWKMFSLEMKSRDNLQVEMLQMMLKRLLILCTRLFKEQHEIIQMDAGQLDVVREFNFLVERHFKTKHHVADYAKLLYKSPKTLSNYFARYNHKTPLQLIQDRIVLEARRLLHYTELPVTEVAYELGFDGIQPFSRFFRNKAGLSPSAYREHSRAEGKIA